MKNGFTLLELIVVIIILGILATLGFSQYVKMVEKGRTAEAKTVLGQMRSANAAYFQEHGAYATALGDLAVDAPTSCTITHYFQYDINGGNARARRCSASGKTPNFTGTVYSISLTWDGVWGGDAGYY